MVRSRVFKAVKKKLGGKTTVVYKEGADGTGVTLPFPCGFCADPKTGLANWAGRTLGERNRHANECPDKG